jgi:hypothetical protein
MLTYARRLVVAIGLGIIGCDSSEPATDSGVGGHSGVHAGEGASGMDSDGGGGTAGTAGHDDAGDGDAGESCMDREQAAWSAVRAALDATELTCETRADCAQISIDTDCHAACGALVSVDDAASITSVIDEQNATTCAGFEDEGCRRVIPPCIPPRDYDCIEGRCTNTEEPVSSCIAQEIAWGPSGGLVAFTQRHTLTPCRTFALERTTLGSMPVVTGCENEIEEDAEIQPGHVDEALASPR